MDRPPARGGHSGGQKRKLKNQLPQYFLAYTFEGERGGPSKILVRGSVRLVSVGTTVIDQEQMEMAKFGAHSPEQVVKWEVKSPTALDHPATIDKACSKQWGARVHFTSASQVLPLAAKCGLRSCPHGLRVHRDIVAALVEGRLKHLVTMSSYCRSLGVDPPERHAAAPVEYIDAPLVGGDNAMADGRSGRRRCGQRLGRNMRRPRLAS